MNASKIVYKPVGAAFKALAGALVCMALKRTWQRFGYDETPGAMEEDRSWREVLLAAAVEGALLAVVKAAVDRGGAHATRRMTGAWPG